MRKPSLLVPAFFHRRSARVARISNSHGHTRAGCSQPLAVVHSLSAAPAAHSITENILARVAWNMYRLGLVVAGLCWIAVACTLCGCSQLNGWVMNESGMAYYNKGDYEAARYEFERALMDNPYRADYAYNVAMAMQHQGDPAGAEQMLQYALTLNPDHELAYRSLTELLVTQGREDDARQLVQAWADTQPYLPGSSIELARWHQRTGDLGSAQQYLSRALSLNPNDPRALNQMGMIYEQTGQPSLAASYYQQSLMLQPMQPEVESRLSGIGWTPGATPALALANKVPLMDPTMNGGVSFAGGPVTHPTQIVTSSGTGSGPHWPYSRPMLSTPMIPGAPRTMTAPPTYGYGAVQYPSLPTTHYPSAPLTHYPNPQHPAYAIPAPHLGAWSAPTAAPYPAVYPSAPSSSHIIASPGAMISPMETPSHATHYGAPPSGAGVGEVPPTIGAGVPTVQPF